MEGGPTREYIVLNKNAAALKTVNRIHYNIKRKEILTRFDARDIVVIMNIFVWHKTGGERGKKHSFSALYRIIA